MTPKEKAIEIVDSYFTIIDGQVEFKLIKQCALIAVDELLNFTWYMPNKRQNEEWQYYWENVKQEITKL
jgi:hypothetical protein